MILKRLEHLDVSDNPFSGECITTALMSMKPLSLKELAARRVISLRISVSEAVIPYTVLKFMQGCDFCVCGSACFNPACSKISTQDITKIASTVILGPLESSMKPFRICVCSDRCLRSKFAKFVSF